MEEGPRKGGPNIACSTFLGWPIAATGLSGRLCSQKMYKIKSSIKQGPLVVASWNERTLQDTGLGARHRTALIACELARYNIDLAALSETRLPDEGSLVETGTGYTFFWSCLPTVACRIHSVGFAVRTALLLSTQESPISIDERLMTLQLPLAKNRFANFARQQNHIAGLFQCQGRQKSRHMAWSHWSSWCWQHE